MSGGPRDGRGESGGADPRQQRHEAVLGLSTWLKIDMISRGKESRRRGTAAPPPSFPLSLSNLGSVSLSHLQTRHPTHPVFILRPARSPATHSSAFSPLLPSCPFSFFCYLRVRNQKKICCLLLGSQGMLSCLVRDLLFVSNSVSMFS